MFVFFILGCIALIVGLCCMFFKEARAVGAVLFVVFVAFTLVSSFTTVGTRNYGVVTSFNKPTGRVLGAGFAMKKPWQKVSDIYGGLDTERFVGRHPNEDKEYLGCIDVRISDRTTACVSGVLQTELSKGKTDEVFQSYRKIQQEDDNYDSINAALNDQFVRTQFTDALGLIFDKYDPLQVPGAVGLDGKLSKTSSPPVQSFAPAVQELLKQKLKGVVKIKSLSLTYIYLSTNTQKRLGQLQGEVANTRIQAQREQTAAKQAAANAALNAGSSLTQLVLQSKCLDMLDNRTDKGLSIPAGFSCFGPTSAGVVVGAK